VFTLRRRPCTENEHFFRQRLENEKYEVENIIIFYEKLMYRKAMRIQNLAPGSAWHLMY